MSAFHCRKPKIQINSTDTSEGLIPHLAIVGDFGIVHAPVCVEAGLRGSDGRVVPLRRDGKLVYALPGGGRVVG